jgi:death on curing protein
MARPQNLAAYESPDAAALAAAYAYGLVRNHGFADGNKRVGWIMARLFLADNGFALQFDGAEAVRTMESVAAGNLSEHDLAEWFRGRLVQT